MSDIDFHRKVTMPIRDMHRDGEIYCLVDIYGVEPRDLTNIGGSIGSKPIRRAVERLGLDTNRYQAVIWDVPL